MGDLSDLEDSAAHRLAQRCVTLPRPWLIGVDVDGTLAPIVARPEMSQLDPRALEALEGLARAGGVMVAVVSGRPLADLRDRFELPSSLMLLGSHGAEVGHEVDARSDEEQRLIESTHATLASVVEQLPGSWIEHKPLAVALHVRQAEPTAAASALAELDHALGSSDELTLHRGHSVLEVAVRPTSKVIAFNRLRSRLEPATTFFIGDDASDERVFASLGPTDVAVKVGPGATVAEHHLDAPSDVVAFLLELGGWLNAGEVSTDEP